MRSRCLLAVRASLKPNILLVDWRGRLRGERYSNLKLGATYFRISYSDRVAIPNFPSPDGTFLQWQYFPVLNPSQFIDHHLIDLPLTTICTPVRTRNGNRAA